MQVFKDFLLNVLIISMPFILYPYLYRLREKPLLHRVLLFALFAVAIIATMCFPVKYNGISYDFRSIPLAIGSLYGGGVITFLLFGSVILGRYLLGSPENLLYTLSILPAFLTVFFFQRIYKTASFRRKVAIAIAQCSLIKLLTLSLFLTYTGRPEQLIDKPLLTAALYLAHGIMVWGFVSLIEFLNRHHHMREEVEKSEKLRLVSDMAASVAHEIRNPLTAVRGFIHLLGTGDVGPDKREFYKGICFSELDRAEQIISDYLSLARTDPESMELIDVNAEVSYLSNILITYANLNNVTLVVTLSKDTSLTTMGDRSKFRQALINIGKNAIEAMPEGGTLRLMTGRLGDQAAVTIRDTGSGMTADQIRRLGTPYYSTKEKGTGLGTMISFSIIKKMDGRIDIKSEVGKGTEFTLAFPRVKVG
ncbi:hypothetical protein D3P08_00985 [Paenibacillus nanensis]|uniref:histidine kinase n=1 Tax=Paenibacillus nanensis TaxID=393251 RepID=A0A3A1VI63_9BACL|nr:ATP-binding protein [Paenibacillus nanensis]RIX60187.1 hypothetical protein D3P08_00985 [Paenibacillus nanensis]